MAAVAGFLAPGVPPAGAVIDPTATARRVADSIASPSVSVTGAAYTELPPGGTPNAASTTALTGFPVNGADYAILTSGSATLADDANTNAGSGVDDGGAPQRGDTDFDVTVLRIDLTVAAGRNCLGFDFRFLTEEFPEYVGGVYNDAFIAELDSSTWTTAGTEIDAPRNFAFDPGGEVISVNSTGATSVRAADAAGTTYDGASGLLSAQTAVTAGPHSLFLSIFDQGDANFDSAAFVDDLVLGSVPDPSEDCAPGATRSNDDFADADTLSGLNGEVTGSNTGATLETGEPTHFAPGGSSVWYRFSPTAGGTATVDTVGSAFDTLLAVYTGTTVGTLTRVAADGDSGGNLTSRVRFRAVAGVTYHVAVDGTGGATGSVVLRFAIDGLPVARAGADRTVAPGTAVTLDGSTSTDPDGGGLDFEWAQVSGPRAVLIDERTARAGVRGLSQTGTYTFVLTVTDASGQQGSDQVVITVRDGAK